MKEHIIFYDSECPFCQFWVQKLLQIDHDEIFLFAPLKGKTAARELEGPVPAHSLVLLENYGEDEERSSIESKAVLRIFWRLGDGWAWLGVLSFLPSFLFDWVYRIIARHRFRFFKKTCINPALYKDRFLD